MASRGRPSSRDAILQAFAEMVAERGYAETSIGDVASALGLSKGTVVHHFGDKESLLGEVHSAYFGRRFVEAGYVRERVTDPMDRLLATIYLLMAAHRDDRAATLACMRELARYFGGDLKETVSGQRRRYRALVEDVLEECRRAGQVLTDDVGLLALQIFGMFNYAWTWFDPDGPWSVEYIATAFAEGLLNGTAAPPAGRVDVAGGMARVVPVVLQAPGRCPVVPHGVA